MKYLRYICNKLKLFFRINLFNTFYFNFHCLCFVQAIHFPILIYGKVLFHDLSGVIEIPQDIKCGMIKIGYRWFDLFPASLMPSQIMVTGKLVFRGHAIISGGTGLFVQNKDAVLSIGDEVTIGGGSLVKSMDVLTIGNRTCITNDCVIMNSNMHIVKNIDTGVVKKPWGPITIGESCWINTGSVVNKGAVIPNYSIVARNSFINKDYSDFGENLFLVGSPAKVTSSKVQRIFGKKREAELIRYFRYEKPNDDSLSLDPGLEIDRGTVF